LWPASRARRAPPSGALGACSTSDQPRAQVPVSLHDTPQPSHACRPDPCREAPLPYPLSPPPTPPATGCRRRSTAPQPAWSAQPRRRAAAAGAVAGGAGSVVAGGGAGRALHLLGAGYEELRARAAPTRVSARAVHAAPPCLRGFGRRQHRRRCAGTARIPARTGGGRVAGSAAPARCCHPAPARHAPGRAGSRASRAAPLPFTTSPRAGAHTST